MFGGGSGSPPKSESAIVDQPGSDGAGSPTGTTSTNNGSSRKADRKSPPPDADSEKLSSSPTPIPNADKAAASSEKRSGSGGNSSPPVSGSGHSSGDQKKRRSNSVSSRASSLLASAKNSLNFSQVGRMNSNSGDSASTANQTPLQKLGRQDAALAVPQGQHNNSAGDSVPGPHSTFHVGVWEDRNKKCRRTMEDTHAFLYNFLRTPAPSLAAGSGAVATEQGSAKSVRSSEAKNTSNTTITSTASSSGSFPDDMLETDNGYFAIFDGHAGTFAADWCGKKLHLILEEIIRKNPNAPIPELLDQTFTSVDSQLEKLPLKNSGCTAAIAVLRWEDRVPSNQSATGSQGIAMATAAATAAITSEDASGTGPTTSATAATPSTPKASSDDKDKASSTSNSSTGQGSDAAAAHAKLKSSASRQRVLYTANVGDARIILCRNGKALRLSYDHKGSDDNEGRRITNAGGLILNNRVNGVLAVTRALGDTYIKDLVTGHPYTTETVIQPELDEFIIIACDGLWDVCSDQDAVNLVRNIQDPIAASKLLVDHALAHFSTDNLSCMIVRLDRDALVESQNSREGLIGVEGDEAELAARPSEADKIVNNAKQRIAEGSPAIGVSASNSGRGHEPAVLPPAAKTITGSSSSATAAAAAASSVTPTASAPSDDSFKPTAIEGSVEEEPSSTSGESSTTTPEGSVSTTGTEDVAMESPTKS